MMIRTPDELHMVYKIGDETHVLRQEAESLTTSPIVITVSREIAQKLIEVGIGLRILSSEEALDNRRATEVHAEQQRVGLGYGSKLS